MSCKLSDFIHQHHIVSYDPSFNTLAPLCKGKIDQGPDSQPDYHDKYHMNPTHNEQAVSVLQYFLSKPINTHLWRLYPPIYILVSNTSGALMANDCGWKWWWGQGNTARLSTSAVSLQLGNTVYRGCCITSKGRPKDLRTHIKSIYKVPAMLTNDLSGMWTYMYILLC